jgi:hypothetical protein
MNRINLIAAIIISSIFIFSCRKDNATRGTENLEDSLTLLQGKWKLLKDSLTNTGNYYFMDNGTAHYPTPGVYWGTADDYWDFLANGALSVHENQQHYNSQYELRADNQLIVQGLEVHGTGKVVTLTATAATFDWSNSSPNGGKYYRRVYLKK